MNLRRTLVSLPFLVAVYAATLASVAPWDLVIGAVLALAVLALFEARGTGGQEDRRTDGPTASSKLKARSSKLVAFVVFVALIAWDIIKGTWEVTLIVLRLRPLSHPGIVAIPFGERTSLGVAVTALTMTLSPGSFPVDIDEDARVLLFHVLDASDPDAVRAHFDGLYTRWQRHVFP